VFWAVKKPSIQTHCGHGLYTVHYVYANLSFHAVAVTIKYCVPQIAFSIRRSRKTQFQISHITEGRGEHLLFQWPASNCWKDYQYMYVGQEGVEWSWWSRTEVFRCYKRDRDS